ncbi:hypothetical protein KY290_000524 [Solanum tuberosum]|uniref:Uncharacterized protein n=1 Tax=Solanum tuberosum TaxID=4113 RepID=A0ABQ7WJL6_SOLTU|nr:hypothetical protein KY289_000573 [Solanum tuberosum]KAH0780926.1 hypothetical protein KY290_000524 [Solanum tuberosum]
MSVLVMPLGPSPKTGLVPGNVVPLPVPVLVPPVDGLVVPGTVVGLVFPPVLLVNKRIKDIKNHVKPINRYTS